MKMTERLVYFDVETTGLHSHRDDQRVEIVNIGAFTTRGHQFQDFIFPTIPIHPAATNHIHGIFAVRNGQRIELAQRGTDGIIPSVDPKTGLIDFLNWLDELGCTYLVRCDFDSL